MLRHASEDVLAERFKQNTKRLLALANALATQGHADGAEGIIDVITILKEVQVDCEKKQAVSANRRLETVRHYRAKRKARGTGSITEDEADTTEGT